VYIVVKVNIIVQGEAFLVITKDEFTVAEKLLEKNLPSLQSALLDGAGGGLQRILLEQICVGAVKTQSDVSSR
jgi:hypothetical protein